MHPLAGLALALAALVLMEAFAYVMHRFVMHGPLWPLHKSHHEPRAGRFEKNDWFALVFALPSILLIFTGTQLGLWAGLAWIGLGIALYGLVYAVFHDILVHRRIANRYVPRSAYMKRIVQAHRLHHTARTKHGAVSFGFLWAPPVRRLRARLAAHGAGMRLPGGA